MTIPVFPALTSVIGWSVKKSPTFSTNVAVHVDGSKVRAARQVFPLWEFELTYEVQRTQTQNQEAYSEYAGYLEFEESCSMFLISLGQYGQFYFDDPDDDSRANGYLAVGDGTTTQFQLYRSWGFGVLQTLDLVGGINEIQNIYYDGTAVDPSTYSYSDNCVITFTSAPGSGVNVTIDFSFYFLCSFIEDNLDYEEFYKNLWTLKSCKFRSVKR